jgi:plastocyanin
MPAVLAIDDATISQEGRTMRRAAHQTEYGGCFFGNGHAIPAPIPADIPLIGWRLIAVCGICALVLSGCGQSAADSAAATTLALASPAASPAVLDTAPQVVIANFTFTPSPLTITVGARIAWVNHDDIPHTVTDTQHRYSSAGLDTNDSFAHTFDAPGTYSYYCTLHPKMTGSIIVR